MTGYSALRVVGTGVFGFLILSIGVGFGVSSVETIPGNARVLVFPARKAWLPDAEFIHARLRRELADVETGRPTWDAVSDMQRSTYGEVRNGQYKGFEVMEGWEEPWDNVRSGNPTSLIQARLFPTESRWNPDGSWNSNWQPYRTSDPY